MQVRPDFVAPLPRSVRSLRARSVWLAIALVAAIAPHAASAQSGSARPIRLIAGFPPGGGVDSTARAVAPALSDLLGEPVVVENRTGAAGNIAAEYVAKSAPDGYTALMLNDGNTIAASLYPKLAYDPIKDFAPVSQLVHGKILLVAHPSVSANNVAELVDYARRNPGKLTYGSPGSGTPQHLSFELFKSQAGNLEITHVPYRGGGPLMVDLLGGQVQLTALGLPATGPHIKSGRLKVFAVTSHTRIAELPGVPTIAEAGLAGFETGIWWGVVLPGGTPAPVVARFFNAVVKAMVQPAVIERIRGLGLEISTSESPAAFAAYIRTDVERWRPIVKASGARVD